MKTKAIIICHNEDGMLMSKKLHCKKCKKRFSDIYYLMDKNHIPPLLCSECSFKIRYVIDVDIPIFTDGGIYEVKGKMEDKINKQIEEGYCLLLQMIRIEEIISRYRMEKYKK